VTVNLPSRRRSRLCARHFVAETSLKSADECEPSCHCEGAEEHEGTTADPVNEPHSCGAQRETCQPMLRAVSERLGHVPGKVKMTLRLYWTDDAMSSERRLRGARGEVSGLSGCARESPEIRSVSRRTLEDQQTA